MNELTTSYTVDGVIDRFGDRFNYESSRCEK